VNQGNDALEVARARRVSTRRGHRTELPQVGQTVVPDSSGCPQSTQREGLGRLTSSGRLGARRRAKRPSASSSPSVALSEGTTRNSVPTMMISGAEPAAGRTTGVSRKGGSGAAEGRRPGQHGGLLADDDYRRDVVLRAGFQRGVDERFDVHFRAARFAEQLLDLPIVERAAQSVGAEEVDVTRQHAGSSHRYTHQLLHAERAGHHVARHPGEQCIVDVRVRFQNVDHQGVIHGNRVEQATAKSVAPAIAHMGHVHHVTIRREGQCDQGGPHSLILRGFLGDLDHLGVGPLDGRGQATRHGPEAEVVDFRAVSQRCGAGLEDVSHGGGRQCTGYVSRVVTARPVRQEKEPELRPQQHLVLVVVSKANVGRSGANGEEGAGHEERIVAHCRGVSLRPAPRLHARSERAHAAKW
jgi:hypothetical protein